ncbi:glycoside hydrolase family 75 protein [Neurospora crassa]|uniref:Endo-chitosanase n=1 Tax=Neurospora crassa (strain ATCC 24698 / 74-OR23-1A / CBS 708.71 / DSM 1257 / FGSC 987) TaxID=367110 RepID=Q7SHJ5_NEUCR|nr:chitosanase [Neurospora crassa OR74A]EAA36355.3 chitosanase [Neurospora crassa OR74A]KHE89321.1 glycoside hydrolase family 75 protein [Neurospora crassa]|eukprot:XP_965591.3 chitosanase [Neurospora crassa OR74A]
MLLSLRFLILTISLLACMAASARDVPSNLQNLYTKLLKQKKCKHPLVSGFYSTADGPNTYSYCGDHLSDFQILYIRGRGRGRLANMDVDCDGVQGGASDDGRCSVGVSADYQSTTAFQDMVAAYNVSGVRDLNTYVHPYVVFGNEVEKNDNDNDNKDLRWNVFDPRAYLVEPLSVMAVVCDGGSKLVYGVWGDTNGDDGDKSMVGEASLALATACGGRAMSGSNGIDEEDVLYLAFVGSEAVPGKMGAKWDAASFEEFERSIEGLGDQLVQRIPADGKASGMVRVSWGLMIWMYVALVGGHLGFY